MRKNSMHKNIDRQTVYPRPRKYGWRHLLRERSWAVLNIVVVAAMVANVSFLGSLIRP